MTKNILYIKKYINFILFKIFKIDHQDDNQD
jgi:hypothetical protein